MDPDLPLPRWRARGQLLEIRTDEVRFREEEASRFLGQTMGLSLSEEEVLTLQRRTEGWVAGLQLAALSLRTRMNAALCQAVTGEQASQERLETLERKRLFVVPLDEHRQWYRLHDLFREALLAQVHAKEPELLPRVHVRAARWYEQQGELREAIVYALAAPDYPYAARLLERAVPSLWLSGEAQSVLIYLALVYYAWSRLAAADQALHQAEALIQQERYATYATWVVPRRVPYWLAAGDLEAARHWAEQLKFSPDTWEPIHKTGLLMQVRVLLAQQQSLQALETLERWSRQLDHH